MNAKTNSEPAEFAELDQNAQETTKQNSFQKKLLRAFKNTTGQCPMVVIPRPVLELCNGELCRAVMLSHLIFLCDKGHRKDGFIYKSFREWTKETGLSQYEVTQSSSWLRGRELIEVDKKRIYGHPTMLYRLNRERLIKGLGAILNKSIEDMSPKLTKKARLKFSQGLLKI